MVTPILITVCLLLSCWEWMCSFLCQSGRMYDSVFLKLYFDFLERSSMDLMVGEILKESSCIRDWVWTLIKFHSYRDSLHIDHLWCLFTCDKIQIYGSDTLFAEISRRKKWWFQLYLSVKYIWSVNIYLDDILSKLSAEWDKRFKHFSKTIAT